MNKVKRNWIIGTVVLVLATNTITLFMGPTIYQFIPNSNVVISRSAYNDIIKFQKMFYVKNQLNKYYDGKIDDSKLVTGAIKGMTEALSDPYTVFMDESESKSFNTTIEGQQYVGIGAQVGIRGSNVIIVNPFEGSPAQKAGIQAGDAIISVDGTAVTANDLNKAVSLMKGKQGTTVKITLNRAGKGNFDVVCTREPVVYNTISGEMLADGIGYIHIDMFDENTGDNFDKKLAELKKSGLKGLIIDLRENGGGVLGDCMKVASNFIDKGKLVVYTVDKDNKKEVFNSYGGTSVGLPLVVLTNGNTASASEIFAGAIKDYKAGTLVGEKTYGKGVVQNTFDTGDNTQLKVTVSKWYTPLGENINHKGFKPDVEVKYPDYEKNLENNTYDRSKDPQFSKALEIINGKVK